MKIPKCVLKFATIYFGVLWIIIAFVCLCPFMSFALLKQWYRTVVESRYNPFENDVFVISLNEESPN
jgi:hypothetical protein